MAFYQAQPQYAAYQQPPPHPRMMMPGGFNNPYQQQQQQQHPEQQQYNHHGQHHQQHHHHHQQQYGGHYSNNQHHPHHHQYYPPPHHPHNGGGGMNMMESEEDRLEAEQANDLLDSDSKHENMLGLDFVPCPATVIVGRGKKVAQHPGNVRFRELVKKELEEYSAATTKAHKSNIIIRVLTEIRSKSHHAFVKQNLTTLRWYKVEENAQRITTAQAFRDALKENYKSSRAFKKLKREEEKKGSDEKPKDKKKERKTSSKKKDASTDGPKSSVARLSPTQEETMQDAASPKPSSSDKGSGEDTDDSKAKASQAALDRMRAMLEAQQSDLVAGNFTMWKPDLEARPMDEEDRKMPPPSSRRNNNSDAIPSNSVASCSSLLWSNHSLFSDQGTAASMSRPPRSGNRDRDNQPFSWNSNHSAMSTSMNGFKWSSHSIKTLSNHSLMTISGHSTRSNSTFNGLMAKYAPSSPAEGNPFEPKPIEVVVRERDDSVTSVDMEMDDVLAGTAGMAVSAKPPPPITTQPYSAKSSSTAFVDDGVALGLGNLSDHSVLSNMSSIHSVRFTAEEIFADTSSSSHHKGSRYRRGVCANW